MANRRQVSFYGASVGKSVAECVQGLRSGPAALTASAARSCALCLRSLLFMRLRTLPSLYICEHSLVSLCVCGRRNIAADLWPQSPSSNIDLGGARKGKRLAAVLREREKREAADPSLKEQRVRQVSFYGASSAKTAGKCVQGLRSGLAALTSSAARSRALCV